MKKLTPALLSLPVLLLPMFASAAVSISIGVGFGSTCPTAICGVAATILDIINNVLVPLLFAIAFIVFLWGVAKAYILSGGDETERAKGHQLVLWGIIGFAVMISLWGLVNVVSTTFGLDMAPAPRPPTSY